MLIRINSRDAGRVTHTSLIFDCDPGVDDAVALFLAFAAQDRLELLGVTTVAGNVAAALTARNACVLRQIAGREDVPVIAGCDRPMVRMPVDAGHFHGKTGLGTLPIFTPDKGVAKGHAVDFIIETVMARRPQSVTLAVTGPMTNLAMAMVKAPQIVGRLGPVVAMGGARREGGNITASAEYNIYADPHAAQVVAESGCDLILMGLDVTHQVLADPERIAAIKALRSPAAQAAATLLDFMTKTELALGTGGAPPQHDLCTIAYLLAPELFTTVPCWLGVETASALTLGHTAVEFRLKDPATATVRWGTQADAQGIFDLLTTYLARSL